jgi:hypothetical protein
MEISRWQSALRAATGVDPKNKWRPGRVQEKEHAIDSPQPSPPSHFQHPWGWAARWASLGKGTKGTQKTKRTAAQHVAAPTRP